MKKITYIGMDVHKKNIVVAESGEPGSSEIIGTYENTDKGLKKLFKKLKEISQDFDIKICYEAGPCGYTLKRELFKKGFHCEVAAPSLIPTKKGDRIKTDKRDAKKLARLYRAQELTFIAIPDEDQEAVRDLVRCRENTMIHLKRIKQQVNGFMLRHGYRYDGCSWTKMHIEWLKSLSFSNRLLGLTIENYMNHIEFLQMQIADLDKEIEAIAQSKEYKEKVEALCAFRGIKTLTAMILISEIVDFNRFANPRELMAYLGLVPSENSSGDTIKKGRITKCGNKRVRRVLVESAHHYRHKNVISKNMKKDLEKVPPELRLAPVKAMSRLNKRYYNLIFKGKSTQKTVVSIARELSGFIWHNMVLIEGK